VIGVFADGSHKSVGQLYNNVRIEIDDRNGLIPQRIKYVARGLALGAHDVMNHLHPFMRTGLIGIGTGIRPLKNSPCLLKVYSDFTFGQCLSDRASHENNRSPFGVLHDLFERRAVFMKVDVRLAVVTCL